MTTDPYTCLLTHLAHTNDHSEIEQLLHALLTDKERQDIANRIRIFDLLDRGVTQREIAAGSSNQYLSRYITKE